jgi:hypothetical protein
MIDLQTAEKMKFNTSMKVSRVDFNSGVQIDFGIRDTEGVSIYQDCVRLNKAQAKQLRVFLQQLE